MFSGTSVPGARTLRISSPRRTESMMTSARATEGGRASSLLSATVNVTNATRPPAIRTFRLVFLGGSRLISTETVLVGFVVRHLLRLDSRKESAFPRFGGIWEHIQARHLGPFGQRA